MERAASDTDLTFTVAIPTYNRPDFLVGALDAVDRLVPAPDVVIVVARADDEGSTEVLRDYRGPHSIRVVAPDRPGLVPAYEAATAVTETSVLVFTDDDARPETDLLARIGAHYRSDPRVGAVGGRDHLVNVEVPMPRRPPAVGRVLAYGRLVGNHHVGEGAARDVHFLKGVLMSFRLSAFDRPLFESRLLGPLVPPAAEISSSLHVGANGYRVVYDPAIVVEHLTAPRSDVHRRHWDAEHARLSGHNYALVLGEYLPLTRYLSWVVWSVLVGNGPAPGLAWSVRATINGRREGAIERLRASMSGLRSGHALAMSSRRARLGKR